MTKIWYIEKVCLSSFLVSFPGIGMKENLNINIPTKERIANLDIFLFYQKFQKILNFFFNCSS